MIFVQKFRKYDNLSYICRIKNTIMKVTALINDELIEEVKAISGGKNITESLVTALKYYVYQNKIGYVIDEIEKEPMVLNEDFAPYGYRKMNRDK